MEWIAWKWNDVGKVINPSLVILC